MTRRHLYSRVLSSLGLIALLGMPLRHPARALAGGAPPSALECPAGMVCNRAIGVAVRPPWGWVAAPPGHFPFNDLALVTLDPQRPEMGLHLVVEPFGTTTLRDPGAAARAAVSAVTQGLTIPVTATPFAVAGLPAVRLRGLPGAPDFGQEIVVAHGGLLYGIYTFDSARDALTPAQRQAMASLRFIPRTGPALRPYDPNATLAVGYNPCLEKRTATRTASPARLSATFAVTPERGNDMVAVKVMGMGLHPRQAVALTACWSRGWHPTYVWYLPMAPVRADAHGVLHAPSGRPTFVMGVPSGSFGAWTVQIVAADAQTGRWLASFTSGPTNRVH